MNFRDENVEGILKKLRRNKTLKDWRKEASKWKREYFQLLDDMILMLKEKKK